MLLNTPKVLAMLASAVTFFGCVGIRATPSAPVVVRSEQNPSIPGDGASSGLNPRQQTKTQQTEFAAYRPCVQGPETLRFLDRHAAEKRNFEDDEVMQFIERLPPLARQRQRKVLEELERETAARWAKKQEQVTVTGQGPSAAEIAEEYIADCSNQLARLSAVAAMPDMWPADAVVRLWQSNLDFMKWWLVNHRQKTGNAR